MAGQKIDILLSVPVHALALGDNISYILVVLLKARLLVRYIWVAVEHVSAPFPFGSLFYIPRIFEFRTIVSQDDRKVFLEKARAQSIVEIVDRFYYTFLCAFGQKYNEHETAE